jgi:predicted  nucleic acid-binding Zn-ribbon protein
LGNADGNPVLTGDFQMINESGIKSNSYYSDLLTKTDWITFQFNEACDRLKELRETNNNLEKQVTRQNQDLENQRNTITFYRLLAFISWLVMAYIIGKKGL